MSSGPISGSPSEQKSTEVQQLSSDIDVVNLSTQLVSMEILPQKEQGRKATKRVRFSLPDGADDATPSESKRKKISDTIIKKKFRIKKVFLGKVIPSMVPKKIGFVDKSCIETVEQSLEKKSHVAFVGDNGASSECVRADDNDPAAMDKNGNCVVTHEQCKSMKRSNFVMKKAKSAAMRCNRKCQQNGRCLKKKKKKMVISKKSKVKGGQLSKKSKGRKRKYGNYDFGNVKKRKISSWKTKKGKKCAQHYKKKKKKTCSKVKCKRSVSKQSRCRSRSCASKVRSVKSKVKKAADRISKARASKQRLKRSRYKKRMTKASKKKYSMKKSAAKKRKKNKTRRNVKKTKAKPKFAKKAPQRRRKLKIRKIEREMDVVEPLRISLLKYLTFEEAYKMKWDCCRRYCWDDWEEIDMFDIIDDHD